MNIAGELRKLQEMHRNGELTDEEFAQAKAVLLNRSAPGPGPAPPETDLTVDPDRDLTPGRLRVMQILAAALILGVVIFLGIVLFLVQVQNGGRGLAPPQDVPIISLVLVVFFVVQAPLSFLLPAFIVRSQLRQIAVGSWALQGRVPNPALFATDGGKLLAGFQSSLIIGLALLEGAAFFGCVAYLLEAQSFALAIVVVAILLMLVRFPTAGGVRSWLERQGAALSALRAQGDFPEAKA
jgi:hypothetical protein